MAALIIALMRLSVLSCARTRAYAFKKVASQGQDAAHRGLKLAELLELLIGYHALRVSSAAVPQHRCLLQEVEVRDKLSVPKGCNRNKVCPLPLACTSCAQNPRSLKSGLEDCQWASALLLIHRERGVTVAPLEISASSELFDSMIRSKATR